MRTALPSAFLTGAAAAAILLFSASADAQGARSRASGGVPSIMVEEGPRAGRSDRSVARSRAARSGEPRRREARPSRREFRRETIVIPRASGALPPSSGEIGSINRSLSVQQQVRGIEQQNQFELNQLRQSIQRNQLSPVGGLGGSPGCPAGSIGC